MTNCGNPAPTCCYFEWVGAQGSAGFVAAAIAHFQQLADEARNRLGADNPGTLAARRGLAFWRGKAGDASGAATEFEVLLADCLVALGPDHLETLGTRSNLAWVWGQAGDPARAVAAFETLLARLPTGARPRPFGDTGHRP